MVDFLFLVVLTILTSSKTAAPYSSMAEVIHLLTHFPASGQQEFADSTHLVGGLQKSGPGPLIQGWCLDSISAVYKLFPPDT